jgi:hypothetical protein
MERKTTARKTAAKTAPKSARPKATPGAKTLAEIANGAKTAPKAKTAPSSRTAKTAPKATAAKTAPKATGPRLTGPTPERIALAVEVAKLRKSGAKWNEIAAATGKSEPTLAKLRKDVRAGIFAKVSPVAKRTPKDAF